MIKTIEMYTVICDNCGVSVFDGCDYDGFSDENYVEQTAEESNWVNDDEKHYCPSCYTYDDDDNLVVLTK